MQVFLIEEVENLKFFNKLFKNIEVKEDKVLLNCKCENVKFNKKIKIVNNIRKVLNKNNVKKVIISKSLKQDTDFINLLYSNGFDIVDGKVLFRLLIHDILKNICEKNDMKSEEKRISVTINEVNSFMLDLVERLSKEFKVLDVVSNNINYFRILKDKLWEDNGIIITLTNNKKKALSKSDIILNVDFSEELINKYVINDNSIWVNLEENVKIKKKRFNGKIINDYNIKLKNSSNIANFLEKKEYEKYDLKDLTEIYVMNNPKEIQDIIIL